MNNQNKDNLNDTDKTGEVISWVIVFILLFTFWPIGLFLLFRKLRGYAKPAQKAAGQQTTNQQATHQQNAYRKAPYQQASYQQTSYQQAPSQQASYQQAQYQQVPYQQAAGQKSAAYTSKPAARKGGKRNPLEKKTGKFISALLLIISIIMVISGIAGASTVIGQMVGLQGVAVSDIILSSFFIFGGIGTFLSRNVVSHRYSRYKNYYANIGDNGIVPLSDLAQVAGVSIKTVKRDLQVMINNGYLSTGAYIDNELDCLVLSVEEARKLRMEIKGAQDKLLQPDDIQPNQYMAILAELREADVLIADETISERIVHLEDLTAKIFRIVEENPEKLPQIKRFLSYYLPTTIKLLRSYATLEKQGIKGENIVSAKQSIGNILDTLSTGYEQQLDKLFKSDVIDIAADINVLENLMQQDGLTDDKLKFQVLAQSDDKPKLQVLEQPDDKPKLQVLEQ